MSKKIFLKGTLFSACTGLISRIAGFFYRIFLSHPVCPFTPDRVQTCPSGEKGARFSLVTGTLMAVFFLLQPVFCFFSTHNFLFPHF